MDKFYKITIAVMAVIIAAQSFYIILSRKPPKEKKPAVKVTVEQKTKTPKKPKTAKGTIAIVLDDWGYNLNNVSEVEDIPYPLTLSVLPNLAYSQKVANLLHKKGFEIILHLPMEPQQRMALERDTILTTMDGQTIQNIIERNISNFPYIKGINNHMGSKATENNRTMQIVLSEMKKRGLYFLDSFVTSGSVAEIEAARARVSFVKRDVFLDNQSDMSYIRNQLLKLAAQAQNRGYAVGIGHDRKNTVEVLKQVMPELAKEGYKFVYLSEIVK